MSPPRATRGWRLIAVAIALQAWTIGTIQYSFTFWIDPWMSEFDASRSELILAIYLAQIGTTWLSRVAGRAMDRWSMGRLCALGLLAFSISLVATTRVGAAWQLVLVYAPLMAIAMPLTGPLMGQSLAAKAFDEGRGMAMGWVTTGTSVGGLIVPPLIAWLIADAGWRTASIVSAGVAVIVFVPLVLGTLRGSDIESEARSTEAGEPAISLSTLEIVRDRAFWIPALGFMPGWGLVSAVQINFGPYASDLGIEAQHAAFFVSLIAGATIGGKLLFGALADRYDHRAMFCGVMGALVLALILMASSPSVMLLAVISLIFGLGTGGLLPLSGMILAAQFGPALFGRVTGLFYLTFAVGSLAAPLAGSIRDRSGSYDSFWYLMAVVIVAAGLPMLRLRPTQSGVSPTLP